MSIIIKGLSVSTGICIGKAILISKDDIKKKEYELILTSSLIKNIT